MSGQGPSLRRADGWNSRCGRQGTARPTICVHPCNPWLKIYECKNQIRHQRPVRHHHGGRARRTVLAGEPRDKCPSNCSRCSANARFCSRPLTACCRSCRRKTFLSSPTRRNCRKSANSFPKIPKANLIAEPIGRDTCAAVTLGAALVGARSTTGVMAVLPADHVIPDEKKFQQVLNDAFDLASRGQAIITIGIKPTGPDTGYGYIQVGQELPPAQGAKKTKTTFFKAERFVEKPDFHRALEYVNSGQYRWNAGMFVWSFRDRHGRVAEASAGDVRRVPALVQGGEPTSQTRQSAGEGISRTSKKSRLITR